ncbi:Aspartate ammonia-lyase [Salinivirga cyanobacteriivorans]|uniref:Aspartate ammonia-lyase n=2 Tax=Salinivirga cyanobacteriivorans TaxID=1307839 RepID=A0A0S2I1X0_9BACT|nr:Aspartate ammonia-lyase [Salinivirga cyanobacteriivorans]
MTKNELTAFIRQVSLFKGLSNDEIQVVAEHVKRKTFSKGAYLFKQHCHREAIYFIAGGEVELFSKTTYGAEKRLAYFGAYDFMGEGSLLDHSPHSTNARAITDVVGYSIEKADLEHLTENHNGITSKIYANLAKVITRRMHQANAQLINAGAQYASGSTRHEHDLLGDRDVPDHVYYGIQTLRALENFNISGVSLQFFPTLISSLGIVKMAAAKANHDLGLLEDDVTDAMVQACDEIMKGKYHRHFVVDMIQGGAGTSTNMNANEVIANRALEIMGHKKGAYEYCHPNNHVNLSQSTNDAYPTAIKIALLYSNIKFVEVLKDLVDSFRQKGQEFADVIKMGRTQLQDAVPMTLGQEFEAYATMLEEEVERLENNADLFLEVNMGATAIGTGINADPDYSEKCVNHLRDITGLDIKLAKNLVEATQDTGAFIMYSSAVKRLAVKLSKISNDLRLLSSGPRTGFNEINLPPMQPGSSIMPGKVNPVIPEVVNQIAFKVIGNDLTVNLASEAGQLELNVMEPIIVQSLFENIEMLKNGMEVLKYRCIDGITANKEHCMNLVHNSIGLVTALNPVLGYEICTKLAKKALEENRSVYDLVLEQKLLSKEELDRVLAPENMVKPHKLTLNK